MKVAIIVPCHNEALRMPTVGFIAADPMFTFIFCNDGSSDRTLDLLKTLPDRRPGTVIVDLSTNRGKGNAIQGAYAQLPQDFWAEFDWIGFMDSDLATPISEARRLLQNQCGEGATSIWASRSPKVGSPIQRELIRGFLGRVFNFMVRLLLNIPIYDTQCGAKFFTKDAAKLAFSEPFISRWIFDLEIYLRLKGSKIIEAPLNQWREVPGSQMRVFKETFRVLGDLFKILGKYGRA